MTLGEEIEEINNKIEILRTFCSSIYFLETNRTKYKGRWRGCKGDNEILYLESGIYFNLDDYIKYKKGEQK